MRMPEFNKATFYCVQCGIKLMTKDALKDHEKTHQQKPKGKSR